MDIVLDPRLVALGFRMEEAILVVDGLPPGYSLNLAQNYIKTPDGQQIPLPAGVKLEIRGNISAITM